MKNFKLIFGLFMLSAFIAVTVLTFTSVEKQAIERNAPIPRQG
ncbi:hypothetical protein [Lutibacter sp.]|nr:hypothetical protein [Lutibacter sp.]MDP3313468.1 hypothetical protein [Lutibacter sp.]